MAELVQLAGIAVGSAFGPVGAALGGIAAQLISRELFPGPAIKGPRLETFRATGSAVGAPMLRAYGNNKLGGELMWVGRIRERTRTKKVGGIGGFGGQKVKSYEYYGTFAIGLCEGEVECLRTIRINGRVFWQDPGYASGNPNYLDQQRRLLQFGADSLTEAELAQYNQTALAVASSQGVGEFFTFYRGTADQAADPTIQQYLGTSAPAYRNTAYVVFNELPLTEYGGALPLIEFEIISGPTSAASTVTFAVEQTLYPWSGGVDPRNPANTHEYRYIKQAVSSDTSPGDPWRSTYAAAVADFESDTGFDGSSLVLLGWSAVSTGSQYSWEMRPYGGDPAGDREIVNLHFNDTYPARGYYQELAAGGANDSTVDCRAVRGGGAILPSFNIWWGDRTEFDSLESEGGAQIGIYYLNDDVANNTQVSLRGRNNNNCTDVIPFQYLKVVPDVIIQCRRVLSCPVAESGTPLPENADYQTVDGNVVPDVTYVPVTGGNFLQLAELFVDGVFIEQYPLGPVLDLDVPGDAALNTEAFWTEFHVAAVAAGRMPAGVYGVDYPVAVTDACNAQIEAPASCTATAKNVADVIEAECVRCTPLTANDIGAALVTDTIWGMLIPGGTSGRDALEQLRLYSFLGGVESDGVLKFVPRGLDAVATLTLDDLGAHEYGSTRPPALEVTRVDDIQLPRRVHIHYIDQNADYQPGEQADSRQITDAVNRQDVELGIVMSGDRGKKIATISLYEQWAARKGLQFPLGPRWLALEPTDCVNIPDGDNLVRVRIETDDLALPGLRKLEGVRDEQSLYGRSAVGPTPNVPDPQGSTVQGPTTLIVLDLAALTTSDADAGYYVAMYGILSGWQNAELFRSLDGGTTYESVLDAGTAIAGTVEAAFDGTEMTVQVYGGALLSTTPEAAAAGTNRFAAGVNGRWVIGTFETATSLGDDRYTLSDIVYGEFNTEWAVETGSPETFGEDGDFFVMLETVSRVAEEDAVVGTEIIFKAVTGGTAFDNAPEQTLIARGNARGFVTSFGATTPAVTLEDGETHVVGVGATGAWLMYDDYLAHVVDGAYVFEFPDNGRTVRTTAGLVYTYTAGSPGYWLLVPESAQQQAEIAEQQAEIEAIDDRVTALEAAPPSDFDPDTILTDGDQVLIDASGNVLIGP